jgi:uncharacterized membrane protein YeiH
MPIWIEYTACAVCAISGVLAAQGKNLDLFGAIMLALATALGGGTLRDLCLGVQPVFWIQSPGFLAVSLLAAGMTFVLARYLKLPGSKYPRQAFAIADAFGLALFGVIGTERALEMGAADSVAILLGVITGVAGGMIRDVLRDEVPAVFQPEVDLYATAVFVGALAYVLMQNWLPPSPSHRYIGMALILILRLVAMKWKLRLPVFRVK